MIRAKHFFCIKAGLIRLALLCPFCGAGEDTRVAGIDESGNEVILLMFDCPFFFRMPVDLMKDDQSIQLFLNNWRKSEGDAWLESVGPVMKSREVRNMERSAK